MKAIENIFTKRVNPKTLLDSKKLEVESKSNPKSFIEDCLRKEGVSLNERLWSRIEKLIDKSWKW